MLVLSRRSGEWIVIRLPDGREVKVQVVRVKGNQVTIGVVADRSIPVLRGELKGAA